MILHINECVPYKAITSEGTYDVKITHVEDIPSSPEHDPGFVMTLQTKDGRMLKELIRVSENTVRLISRIANLVGIYRTPIDSHDFVGHYLTVHVEYFRNKYRVCGYDRCLEPFTEAVDA